MANEGTAGPGSGELLTASVGDQLREKAELEQQAERERRAAEEREATTERHKEAERKTVAAHGGDPETFRAARETARRKPVQRQPTTGMLVMIALGVAVVVRAVFGRRRPARLHRRRTPLGAGGSRRPCPS